MASKGSILSIISFLVVSCAGQGTVIQNTYPLDWNIVPTAPIPLNLTANCICDLTAYACDPNCCCDPNCLPQVVNAAIANNECLPEGPPAQTLDYCLGNNVIQQVNLPSNGEFFSVVKTNANDAFFDQLLCISSSANPDLGPSYADPAPGNPGTLVSCLPGLSPPGYPASYESGTPLLVIDKAYPSVTQPLTVPYPALSQECSDDYQPGFLLPIPDNSQDVYTQCTRDTTQGLEASCNDPYGPFSAYAYTSLSFLQLPTSSAGLASLVTPQILYLNPSTGTLTNVAVITNLASPPPPSPPPSPPPPPPSPSPPIYQPPSSPSTVSPPNTTPSTTPPGPLPPQPSPPHPSPPPPTPSFVATSAAYFNNGTCHNALKYINITFVYNPIAATDTTLTTATVQLTQVQISLVITDFSASAPSFTQNVRVDFVNQTYGTVGNNPYPVQPLSGNPGYQTGYPVLAGYTVNTFTPDQGSKTAIQRLTSGIPLPVGSVDGTCSAASLSPLRFGVNTTSSCNVKMTLADLQSYCKPSNQTFFISTVLGSFLSNLQQGNVSVGVWGNSNWTNPNNNSAWIQAAWNGGGSAASYNSATQTCTNAIIGISFQIQTGVAFAANNLQSKVLYISACYYVGTWTFPLTSNSSSARSFVLTSVVNFTALQQSATYNNLKPTPPLALPLSPQIFYPFVTSAVAPLPSPALPMLFIALITGAVLLHLF